MKIDDVSIDNLSRLLSTSSPAVASSSAEEAVSTGLPLVSSESFELLVNTSLLEFARNMDRGQTLLRSLPEDVRSFIDKQATAVGTSAASLEEGLTPPVQMQRKFVEVVRTLAQDFDILRNLRPENQQTSPVLSEATSQRIEALFQKLVATWTATTTTGIFSAGTAMTAAEPQIAAAASATETVLLKVIVQAGSTGRMPENVSNWVAGLPLAPSAKDPGMADAYRILAPLMAQADPAVRELSQKTQRSDFVTAAAVLQAMQSDAFAQLPAPVREALTQWLSRSAEAFQQQPETAEALLQNLPQTVAGKLELLSRQAAVNPALMSDLQELVELTVPAEGMEPTTVLTKAASALLLPDRMIPAEIREMTTRLERPGLALVWQESKMMDLQQWLSKDPQTLERISQSLRELANLYEFPKAGTPQAKSSTGEMSYAWQLVFYPGGQDKPYPALVQVFRDGGDEEGPNIRNREDIWVRVAIKTQNIGVVDLSFHLQGRQFLSITTRFADAETAAQFRQWRGELIETVSSSAFDLRAFQINSRMPATEG